MKRVLSVLLCILLLLTSLNFVAFASEEIIITTADNLCKLEGDNWKESTNVLVAGPLDGTSWYTDDKNATATYDASSLDKGNYGVYIYMTPYATTADKVDVKVIASGKTAKHIIDAMHGGQGNRHWLFLGKYDFDGTETDAVIQKINPNAEKVNGDGKSGYMRASGVKFIKNDTNTAEPETLETKLPEPIVTEDGIIITAGNGCCDLIGDGWLESTNVGVAGPLDGTSWYTTNKEDLAKYDASFLKEGNYGVYLYVTPWGKTADIVDVTITASGKTTTIMTNGDDGGTGNRHWIFLGKYNFNGSEGDNIVQKMNINASSGAMRSSGVRFVKDDTNTGEIDSYYSPKLSVFWGTDLHILERMGLYEGKKVTNSYVNSKITREDMAVMLTKLFGKEDDISYEITDEKLSSGEISEFNDTTSHKYQKMFSWIRNHPEFGLGRKGNNSFSPDSPATRTDLIKFILTQLGYHENVDYDAKDLKEFAENLSIKTDVDEHLTPKTVAEILYSALEIPIKNDPEYSFFEKLVRENSGIQDDDLLERKPFTEEMRERRTISKNKDRDVIYNNDGNDVYVKYANYPGPFDASGLDGNTITTENFLAKRTKGIEDTKVKTLMYCTGVNNSYTHESQETDQRVRDWSYRLKEFTGKDTLQTMTEYVHNAGIEILWSIRMNDTHDHAYVESELDSWKQANLDKLFARKSDASLMSYCDKRWSSIDFTHTESRQKMYNILKDVISRYDIDGLELDFTRFPTYFKESSLGYEVYPENTERMNEFVRMVRALTEQYSMERNKPMLLTIYVPDSIKFCKYIGLDVETWIKEDLIDFAAIGSHIGYFQPWEDSIGEYNAITDENNLPRLPVYAALDSLGYSNNQNLYSNDCNEALIAYEAGAKGIYTYNYFDINHQRFDDLYSKEAIPQNYIITNYKTKRKKYSGSYGKDTAAFVTLK